MSSPSLPVSAPAKRLAARQGADRQLEADFLSGIEGDAAAYRRFLDGLLGLLRTYFRHRLQNAADMEDLVQETVLAVHGRRHTLSGEVPLTAWIHAIARYKLMDWLRAHAALRHSHVDLDEAESLQDEGCGAWEARHDLQHLLQALPAKQRLAIMHVRIWGQSVREAAQRLGISESDVKVSVHRGLRALTLQVLGPAHAS